MSENSNFNNFKDHQLNMNTEEIDYQNLIKRLKDIKRNIDLLGKTIFK